MLKAGKNYVFKDQGRMVWSNMGKTRMSFAMGMNKQAMNSLFQVSFFFYARIKILTNFFTFLFSLPATQTIAGSWFCSYL